MTENFAAGVLERLGFGYERHERIRPDIIYVSNCGFGHAGPYAAFKTWGPIVQAVSGLTFASGLPGPAAGRMGLFLHGPHRRLLHGHGHPGRRCRHRKRTGEGQWVDLACTEAAPTLHRSGPAGLDRQRPADAAPAAMPDTNRSQWPPMAPHGIYPAPGEDAWVAIACRDDRDWEASARVDSVESWAADSRTSPRVAGRRARTRSTRTSRRGRGPGPLRCRPPGLRRLGVPCRGSHPPPERIDQDPDVAAGASGPTVDHTAMGEVRVDGLPAHLSETDWAIDAGGAAARRAQRGGVWPTSSASSRRTSTAREQGVI